MNLDFLPTLPLQLSYPLLFGVLLVAGMMGGEAARVLRMPRVVGYVLIGFLLGPLARMVSWDPIEEARIFVDLALGMVLFDLGRRMDLKWMRRDLTLPITGLVESLLAFGAVFAVLRWLDYPAIESGIAAAIAMTTSPAVVMLIAHDTRSEGQVTSRAMNLTALNGLLASIITTILLGSAHLGGKRWDVDSAFLHPLYLFIGSLLVGAVMAWVSRAIARSVERSRDVHFTLVAGLVVAAVGLASLLKLPVILALLAFGMFARNDQRGYELLNVSLAPVGRLLYIVLFVITGASLPLESLAAGGVAVLAIAAARVAGKVLGVLAIAPIGGLSLRQSFALGLVMTPMSSLALLMYHDISRHFPRFADELGAAFLGAVIVMEIVGSLAVQYGLALSNEMQPETGMLTMPPRGSRRQAPQNAA